MFHVWCSMILYARRRIIPNSYLNSLAVFGAITLVIFIVGNIVKLCGYNLSGHELRYVAISVLLIFHGNTKYSVNANNLLILPRTCAQLFLHVFHCSVCLYNYHWVYSKMVQTQGTVWRQRQLYTEIENYPEGGRDSLKQFRNFPKPFLSALIKFVQSKPIIYENKTIWKRWRSNTLSLSLSHTLTLSQYTRRRWRRWQTGDKRVGRVQSQYFQKAFAEALKATGEVWFFYTLCRKG